MKENRTLKALVLLSKNKNITAKQFAELFWPDSPSWKKRWNVGNGATSGSGMWLSAGSFLSKLKTKGLVISDLNSSSVTIWQISNKGIKFLKENEIH